MSWLLLGSALAFDSVCHTEDGEVCKYGYEAARNRWLNEDSEHAHIFAATLSLSGLPEDLNEPFSLRHFSSDDEFVGTVSGKTFESYMPVRADPKKVRNRVVTIGEFSQLPDFSYSLYDWLAGNELCDAYSVLTDPERCHQFKTHMGALNSSHFLPQARRFFEHYHVLAMNRALECAQIGDDISAIDSDAVDRHERVILACEKEAMVLEAIAQHYLQDAWSMGHMWERWGGPDISDWNEGLGAAQVVAMVSGLIHGVKGAWPTENKPDDPMCAPHADVDYLDVATGSTQLGAGDLFWASFLANNINPQYEDQNKALLGCSIAGLREVYEQTHQRHGVMVAADGNNADLTRDVWNDHCWNQRATIDAIDTGFQLHLSGTAPNTTAPIPKAIFVSVLGHLGTLNAWFNSGVALTGPQEAQLQQDVALNGAIIAFWAQYGGAGADTFLASGGLDPILGAEPNGSYERGGQGNLADPPASYLDPELPWTADGDYRSALLNLGFATAHGPDRCPDLTTSILEGYRADAEAAQGTSAFAAACGLCAQMATPHMRIGLNSGDYDGTREPICSFTNPGSQYVYTGTWDVEGNNSLAARQWCGCGGRMAVLVRGGSPGMTLWSRSAENADPLPVGEGTTAGDVMPTAGTAREIALGGPYGDWAFVSSNDGTLSVFELLDGYERELDADWDSDTTDSGAPSGVTRMVVGSTPRGIGLMHTGPYGIVATADGLTFFDAEYLTVLATLSNTDLGITGDDRPYDVAITPDDSTAFVTVWGGFSTPSNETLVLDLSGLLSGIDPDSSMVTASIVTGGDTNNQYLELSHDGTMVAITCPNTDRVLVIESTAPYDRVGIYIEYSFFEPSPNPIAVAWAPDDESIFVGYISGPISSTIWANGTVRRCYLDQDHNCEHAVPVQGAVRSIGVAGEGDDLVVWVADDDGYVTGLTDELFEPGQYSGYGSNALYDGTGGCLNENARAEACDPTGFLGQAAGGMVVY